MAFHIFNISVDTADTNPDYVPEDLSFNDQESFVELLIEKIFGFENAIAEHDEEDEDSGAVELNKEFNAYSGSEQQISFISYYTGLLHNTPFSERTLPDFFGEINPPPPKA